MKQQLENPFESIANNGNAITTQSDAQPLDWSEFARQAGLRGTSKTAEDLVNMTFDIMRAKRFESAFEGQDHAWFCIVRPIDQDELFEVTLGGQAVVEILDAYAESGYTNPLRVTLTFKTGGGKFKGYYNFA